MSTLTPTKRERAQARWEALQAVEKAKPHPPLTQDQKDRIQAGIEAHLAGEDTDHLYLYPKPLNGLRRPDPWYLRLYWWAWARFNRYVLYECWTGRPATPGHTCDECEKRATKRHDRFWGILEILAVVGILAYGLWVSRPQ